MAVQLQFTNGIESPLFQKDAIANKANEDGYELKNLEIDPTKKIVKVSFKVREIDNAMCALRLIDESATNVIELEWIKTDNDAWVSCDIPDGHEIIGLYMSTAGLTEHIQSLGFMLWRPNPNATD